MFGLPGWAWKAIGYLVIVLVIAGVGLRLGLIWNAHTVTDLKSQINSSNAQAHAILVVQKAITVADKSAETQAQATIASQGQVIIKRVPVYVKAAVPPNGAGCLTVGELRVYDGAVLGVDPADVQPPAGQPDDACSTLAPRDFMAGVVANLTAARANAEQLNALEGDIKSRSQAVADPTSAQPAPPVGPSP